MIPLSNHKIKSIILYIQCLFQQNRQSNFHRKSNYQSFIFINNTQQYMLVSQELQPVGSSGRWTKDQHLRFVQGLQLYGRNWKEISKLVKTRNGAQIRSHAQKFFDKIQKSDDRKQSSMDSPIEKVNSITDLSSAPEQEANSKYSYFFPEILKYLVDNKQGNFWKQSFDLGSSYITVSQPEFSKSNNSFTRYPSTSQIHWIKNEQASLEHKL